MIINIELRTNIYIKKRSKVVKVILTQESDEKPNSKSIFDAIV